MMKGITFFVFAIVFFFFGNTISAQEKKNYTSLVPHFEFPQTYSKQEEALKSNPLMLRFKESREKFKNDKYRPIYHFVNPEERLNDPNGLCFWNNQWHLFYQAYPPEDPRQHWGHAVSSDLIHWRDLPYAIYPDPERACFSGATFVENNRVIAMYHGTMEGNMVAVSNDPLLLNWEKLSGHAVIPMKSKTGFPLPYKVFDPCIWKKDSIYYSLSGRQTPAGYDEKSKRAHYLFRSKDLVNWEYMHEFVENDRFTMIGDDGACPYFWPIGNKYLLAFFSHMTGAQYFLGNYDKENDKFFASSHGRFSFGSPWPSGVHAPSATPDGKDGVIIIFNMNHGYATKGWNGIMSLPRQLTLSSHNELKMEPAGDIESLRYNPKHLSGLKLAANKELVLKNIKGNSMEVIAEIDLKKSQVFRMNVLQSPDKDEYTSIVFLKNKGSSKARECNTGSVEAPKYNDTKYSLISLETMNSSELADVSIRPHETASLLLEADENLKLRVFIDKSVVEVFVNGKQCIAARVYPGRDDSVGVSLLSKGGDSELVSLNAFQMKSIWE